MFSGSHLRFTKKKSPCFLEVILDLQRKNPMFSGGHLRFTKKKSPMFSGDHLRYTNKNSPCFLEVITTRKHGGFSVCKSKMTTRSGFFVGKSKMTTRKLYGGFFCW
jgi:hypothetical protein